MSRESPFICRLMSSRHHVLTDEYMCVRRISFPCLLCFAFTFALAFALLLLCSIVADGVRPLARGTLEKFPLEVTCVPVCVHEP